MSTDGWNRDDTPMTRGEFGVWEVTLPAKDGHLEIPHNTKVKVRNTTSTSMMLAIDKVADIHGHSHISRAY